MASEPADVTSAPAAGETSATDPDGTGAHKALQAEREARREAERALRDLQGKLAEMESEQARDRVAAATGVPAELLTGTSEEELTASAEKLTAWAKTGQAVKARPAVRPEPSAGDRDNPGDPAEIASRVLRG